MLALFSSVQSQIIYKVSGIVEDNQTRMPLKNVSITTSANTTITTNTSGYFTFELRSAEIPMMLKFTHPQYLKKTYKIERFRFNKDHELWLNIMLHPTDSSKIKITDENIGNTVVKIPEVNVYDFHIVDDLLYVLIETVQGFDYLQVYDLNDSLLAQIEVDYKYEKFYHQSRFDCYISDQNYGCMRKVNYANGQITLGEEECAAGFIYRVFGDARVGNLILQQQDIYLPKTLRVFYLTPELSLDFDYYQLIYVSSLNNFIVRGDTAQYNYVKNECLNGKFSEDMNTFIDNKIASNSKYKDSISMLTQFYVDTMYSDWFRVKASAIIYSSLDEAYKIRSDMQEYDYRYYPVCRPTFLEVNNEYYIFNFTNLALTKLNKDMKFISTIPLDANYFSYFYKRDHNVITSYQNAYIVGSMDDLGHLYQIDLNTGSVTGQQLLLRTTTSEHRVEARNGYVYYISYYSYLDKNLYKEPLIMQPLDEKKK